jgi:hypothetical protein
MVLRPAISRAPKHPSRPPTASLGQRAARFQFVAGRLRATVSLRGRVVAGSASERLLDDTADFLAVWGIEKIEVVVAAASHDAAGVAEFSEPLDPVVPADAAGAAASEPERGNGALERAKS